MNTQKNAPKKPLNKKAYGSIPHLPQSRLGEGDHHIHEMQGKYLTEKSRDKNTVIVVQEKLDGSNVAVVKLNGEVIPLIRAGYRAETSHWEQHRLFHRWVLSQYERFDSLLEEGERAVGEWLLEPHGTLYNLKHEPFVIFDIMQGNDRLLSAWVKKRCKDYKFITPFEIHRGEPISVKKALDLLGKHGRHGAIDEVEGVVYRMEKGYKVEYLSKFVKHDKIDGKYFEGEPVNNKWDGENVTTKLLGVIS